MRPLYFKHTTSLSYEEHLSAFALALSRYIAHFSKKYHTDSVVLICIGSVRSTGDSLGPMIGYKLTGVPVENLHIYGTLQKPVHALNLDTLVVHIKKKHPHAVVIAVDASVGYASHIGYITLNRGPLKPGLGVNKKLPAVGDIAITGIVNRCMNGDEFLLHSTSLALVMEIADFIVLGLLEALYLLGWSVPAPAKYTKSADPLFLYS